jgi:DNA-binding GntR family transcriptional regulator
MNKDNNNEFPILAAPSSRTLGDHVTQQLRNAILTGQLRPGQRIVEREIAEAMQTSRGPVRDALKLLENERLVVRYPHKGTFVAWLNVKDAEEIYSLREALESLALDYVFKNATEEQIDELDELVQSMAIQADQGYTEFEATDIDLEFHRTMCHISGHKRLLAAWEALDPQVRMLLLRHRTLLPSDFRERGVEWHRQIVDALRTRDTEQAHRLLQKHLAASFETLVQSFSEDEDEPPAPEE